MRFGYLAVFGGAEVRLDRCQCAIDYRLDGGPAVRFGLDRRALWAGERVSGPPWPATGRREPWRVGGPPSVRRLLQAGGCGSGSPRSGWMQERGPSRGRRAAGTHRLGRSGTSHRGTPVAGVSSGRDAPGSLVADAPSTTCFTERGGTAVSDRNRHLGVGVRRRRGLAGRPAAANPSRRSTRRLVKQPRAAGRMTSEAGRRPVPARHKCDFRGGGSGYDALSQRRRTNCREADRRSCERPAAVARRIEACGCWRSGAAESRSRGWPLLRATVLPVACRRVGSMVLPPSELIGRGDCLGDCPRERPKTAAPEAVGRATLMPRSRRCRCSPCRWRSAVALRSRSGEGPVPARRGRSWRRRFAGVDAGLGYCTTKTRVGLRKFPVAGFYLPLRFWYGGVRAQSRPLVQRWAFPMTGSRPPARLAASEHQSLRPASTGGRP